jgi:hypothetical protein
MVGENRNIHKSTGNMTGKAQNAAPHKTRLNYNIAFLNCILAAVIVCWWRPSILPMIL